MAKRGQPTTQDRERLAATLVRARRITPEQYDPFLVYPGVQALLKQLQTHVCGAPLAVQALSDGALHDVYRATKAVRTSEYRQIATFLRLLTCHHKNVSAVAREMGLSRMYVVRTLQPQACLLVAKRFVYLAEQTDPWSASAGVRGVLRHEPS
jgi:hypothetical protein